jgi:ribonucleotide reductase alpha subunit
VAQEFDYSLVRPAGQPIRGFGGLASGPGPLRDMHEACRAALDANAPQPLSVTTIVDVMNLIGKCVVAGNVRRTAEIAFGDPRSDEYIDLKNYELNPHRVGHGWTSNNSVFAELGMDYDHLVPRIQANGEPGFAWLDNMRNFGRMNGTPDASDHRAMGGNPCLEQTLESYELCCLVETFPNRHASRAEFEKTLRSAFLYAKTVTLGETHWPQSNRVMLRNRRIGCSVSGVAQFISR